MIDEIWPKVQNWHISETNMYYLKSRTTLYFTLVSELSLWMCQTQKYQKIEKHV